MHFLSLFVVRIKIITIDGVHSLALFVVLSPGSMHSLTLYHLGGGQKAPDDHKSFCRFRRARARLTKILDFVPFNTWQVPEKPFLKFVFENFAKLNVKNFRGSSSIRWKIEKSKKNLIFFKKSYFFWLNLYCTCSQLSFEVYMTSVAQNLKFRPFLTWKIWFLTFVFWQLVAAKVFSIHPILYRQIGFYFR